MKERPILFSAPMVRAILEGKKTQTRRVWKQPTSLCMKDDCLYATEHDARQSFNPIARDEIVCPYGQRGDRLWVRETWQYSWAPEDADLKDCYIYKADFPEYKATPWRPSIHMPRAASRLTLEVMGVRVERLQDISEDDASAEGCPLPMRQRKQYVDRDDTAYGWFRQLWKVINGVESWDQNPWVWVVEFKKVEAENGK